MLLIMKRNCVVSFITRSPCSIQSTSPHAPSRTYGIDNKRDCRSIGEKEKQKGDAVIKSLCHGDDDDWQEEEEEEEKKKEKENEVE